MVKKTIGTYTQMQRGSWVFGFSEKNINRFYKMQIGLNELLSCDTENFVQENVEKIIQSSRSKRLSVGCFVLGHSFTEARSPHACYINPKGQAGTGTTSVGGCS